MKPEGSNLSVTVWWIPTVHLTGFGRTIENRRLPLNQVGSLNKINKAFQKFEQENERRPSAEELAKELDVPVEKVSDSLKVSGRHVSMDAPLWKAKITFAGCIGKR